MWYCRFDLPCHEIVYEDKGKLKKWNRLSKKQKHGAAGCTSSGSKGSISAENSPVEALYQQINAGFLMHLQELKAFLMLEKSMYSKLNNILDLICKYSIYNRYNARRHFPQNRLSISTKWATSASTKWQTARFRRRWLFSTRLCYHIQRLFSRLTGTTAHRRSLPGTSTNSAVMSGIGFVQ